MENMYLTKIFNLLLMQLCARKSLTFHQNDFVESNFCL